MQIQAAFAAGWIGICVGCFAGAVQGLFFHGENWLGGYNSWARRMLRLGHISLVGLGLLNLAFALSMTALGITVGTLWPWRLLLAGAVSMPLLCYLSAFKSDFRHLFFIPALSVIAAAAMTAWRVLSR